MTPEDRARRLVPPESIDAQWIETIRRRVADEIREAVAEEREACAKLAEDRATCDPGDGWGIAASREEWTIYSRMIAAAIRAQSEL